MTAHTNSSSQARTWSIKQELAIGLGALLLASIAILVACSDNKSSKPAAASNAGQTPSAPAVTAPSTPAPVLPPAPVARKKAKKRPANVTYSDVSTGVSFQYPRQYVLKVGEEQVKSLKAEPLPMDFAQAGGVTLATLEVPKNAYPGTDFDSAVFSVNANQGLTETQCGQFAFSTDSDEAPVSVSKVMIGEREFASAEDFSGTAAKPRDARYYHLFENGACYEFALGIDRSGSTSEDGVTPVDRKEVFSKLEKILATVKTHAPATPEVATTTPAAETEKTNR